MFKLPYIKLYDSNYQISNQLKSTKPVISFKIQDRTKFNLAIYIIPGNNQNFPLGPFKVKEALHSKLTSICT